jgi:hypothetical protein
MSDEVSVRQRLLEGIAQQGDARGAMIARKNLDITAPQYVEPRSIAVQRKLKEAGIEGVDAATLQKVLAIARPPPKRKVPYSDNKRLADVISHHGITHIPELNNITTAKSWLENKIQHAVASGDDKSA